MLISKTLEELLTAAVLVMLSLSLSYVVWARLTLSEVGWFVDGTRRHCLMPISGRLVALDLASSSELCFTFIPSSLRAGIKAKGGW